jgi:hypothetical protein
VDTRASPGCEPKGLRYPSDLTDAECMIVVRRHFLRAVQRLRMEGVAQGPATNEHDVGLFRPGTGRWNVFITRSIWRCWRRSNM